MPSNTTECTANLSPTVVDPVDVLAEADLELVCERCLKENVRAPAVSNGCSVRRRKSPCPRASAPRIDHKFKGVVFKFKTVLHSGKPCLLVDASYRRLSRYISEPVTRIEEDDDDPFNSGVFSGRKCASCSTRRTALWRGAEDGTTLCNACGIRYRKYRIRCRTCWLVPTRDIQGSTNCPRCAQTLR